MDRKSIKAIKIYSKYGVIVFYLYILMILLRNYFSNKKELGNGWYFDFSHDLATDKLEVRKIKSEFENLSYVDIEDKEIKEDVYPLS
tara:strand:- start:1058 stop:1318 length:261 start_codon:yes stop_codon:yes gene_type:complete